MNNLQFAEDLSFTFDLKQHITNATKTTATSVILIDHIYSYGINNIDTYVCEQHIANQISLGFTIKITKLQVPNTELNKLKTFRPLKKLDYTALFTDLSAIPWVNILYELPNVNAMISNFNTKFLSI